MNTASPTIKERLLGAWTLVEWSEQQADKSKVFPLGDDAIGQIIYTADGYVAAQLARGGRRSFPSRDWRDAGQDDAARAFKDYFGYFGTFSIDTERQVVTHHVEGSWFPNLEGSDQERHYRFENDQLVLDADTDWGTVKIVWRKAPATREKTKIVESVKVAEAADTLWRTIGAFGAIGEWHPMLAQVRSEGEREGSLRTAQGRDGNRQTERLLEMHPDRHAYRYRMEGSAMPVRDYVAELKVEDNGDKTSTVVWSAEFEPTADDAKTADTVRGFLRAGLDNIGARRF
jgi:mxaD protein